MWSEVPDEPTWRYHPDNWQMRERPGTIGNMSPQQLDDINTLQSVLEREGYWEDFAEEELDHEVPFLKLARFLRARKWDMNAAWSLCKENVDWKNNNNKELAGLRSRTCNDILKVDYVRDLHPYYPSWIQNVDKQGRPVCYRVFGKFDVPKILESIEMDNFVKFHVFETEMALRAAKCSSRKLGYNIEACTIVVDVQGWGMHLATADALEFIKKMVSADNIHFSERMGQMLLVNAPWSFSTLWMLLYPMLDPITTAKIQIISSRSAWEKKLFEIVDQSLVPREFGGHAPDLTPLQQVISLHTAGMDWEEAKETELKFIRQREEMFSHVVRTNPVHDVQEYVPVLETTVPRKGKFKNIVYSYNGHDEAPIRKRQADSWYRRAASLRFDVDEGTHSHILHSSKRHEGSGLQGFLSMAQGVTMAMLGAGQEDDIYEESSPPLYHGAYELSDGREYTGYWQYGKFAREGTLRFPNGTTYRGGFLNGKYHGKGKLVFSNLQGFHGECGNVYEGLFLYGQFHDVDGKLWLMGGVSYRGGFVNGLKHGKGRLSMGNGKIITGNFVGDECPVGMIEYGNHVREYRVDGKLLGYYRGGIKHGLRHGNGALTFADGSKLKGKFKNDAFVTKEIELHDFLKEC
jgi:hypothetical protein